MPKKDNEFSSPIPCLHCGNTVPMEIVGTQEAVEALVEDGHIYGEEGPVWELLFCQTCKNVTLREGYWDHHLSQYGLSVEYEVVYPQMGDSLPGLPDDVSKGREACFRVRGVDSNAYGMLVRRLISLVCIDRKAEGRDLHHQLNDLAAKGEIPANLANIAHKIKSFGNIGAHPELGEVTTEEVPIIEKLSEAVLNYVYVAPWLIHEADIALTAKKQATHKRKKTQ